MNIFINVLIVLAGLITGALLAGVIIWTVIAYMIPRQ
jgi:hypothetical protein